MSRLYTMSILMACACGARLGASPADEPTDGPYAFVEQDLELEPITLDPSVDPVARAEAATEEAATEEDVQPEVVVEPERVLVYELRRGETLAHFARWSELPVETVAAASGLSPLDDLLPVGTVVRVPWSEGLEGLVVQRRDAHHVRRAEGWLLSRGGSVGVTFHTVTSGESAWSIAHDNGDLPVWLIETYNPAVDLERLRPGQELMLPEFPDPIAELSLPE